MRHRSIAPRFHGAWRLVSPSADGILFYDPSGAMSVQTAPITNATLPGGLPPAQAALAAITGYVAYFGTWSIDEKARTVTHVQSATVQPVPTAALVRSFEFLGPDRLVLRPVDRDGEIVWQRIAVGVKPSASDTIDEGGPP